MQSPTSSSSVSVSRAKNAFKHVNDAIQLFDQIFIEVAPVNGYNDPNVGKEVKIPQTNLTDKQCNLIKEISGHLIGVRNNLLHKSGSEPLTPATEQRIVQDSSATVHMARQYNLLKDYLIAELNKSEIASNNLKVKEEELVIITAERDKLKKKLANITANGGTYHTTGISTTVSSSSSKNTTKKETELPMKCDVDPNCYVGGFIRKPFGSSYFFGLIASYDELAGYYQLVYEDADFEDLTFSEMKRVLWSGATPTAKREACMKHAKLLNKLTDEECMQLAETYNATNGVGIVVGTGRTRKPSLSSSGTSSGSSSSDNSGSTTSSSSSRGSNGNREDIIEVTSTSSAGSNNIKAAVEDVPVAPVTDGENSNGSDIPRTNNTTSSSSSSSSSSSNSGTSTQLPQKQKDASSSIATVRAMIKSATSNTDTTRTTTTNLTTTSTTCSNTQQISTPTVSSTTTTTIAAATTTEAAETGTSNLLLLQKLVQVNAAIAPSPPAALSCVVGDSKERPKSKPTDSSSVKASTTTTSIAAVAIPRNALTDKVRAKNTASTPTPTATTTSTTTPTTTPSASQVNTINEDSDDSSVVFIGSNPSPHSAQPTCAVVNLTSSTKALTQSVRVSSSSNSSSKLQSTDLNRAAAATAGITVGKRRLEEESEFTVVQVANKRVAK